jgi:hypothetical protein
MKRSTRYPERQEIVQLRQQGLSYQQIADQTGWSYYTVRKICRAYKRNGEITLLPQAAGRPASGPLSGFDPKVRFASLKIKRQHPGWGPDVVRAELAKRAWAQELPLPSAVRIGVYFSQFGDRLITPRPHKQLTEGKPLEPALRSVHACWQIDIDERVDFSGYGLVHILNFVDYATGIKIGSFLFPAKENGRLRKVRWPQYRFALRQAFTRWGLPKRIRTDRERVLVAEGDYPFPMPFTLWLVGLGIEHEIIRRVIENGGVERSHRTWEARLNGYGPFDRLAQWQMIVDYERWRMNAILPSRGRNCQRQPPLQVYPEARQALRPYRLADEQALFDLERVHRYLEQGKWLRHTSSKGQFAFNAQHFGLGVAHKQRWVAIRFAAVEGFWVETVPKGSFIQSIPVEGISAEAITGLSEGV